MGQKATSAKPEDAGHVRTVHRFISLYRYFGFTLGTLLVAVWPRIYGTIPGEKDYVVILAAGLLTIYKVVQPRYELWRINPIFLAGSEMALILAMTIWTGGLNSGLLLYTFAPVIATALLYEMKLPLALAIGAASAMLGAHLLLPLWFSGLHWLWEGSLFVFFVLYVTALLLTAFLPQRVNLSLRQRLEGDATNRERRRISWEIHDGLAQSMAYLRLQNRQVMRIVRSGDIERAIAVLEENSRLIQEAYNDVREDIELLRQEQTIPSLAASLSAFVEEMVSRYGLKAEVDIPSKRLVLPAMVELHIRGIMQGALGNIVKHAKATIVRVSLQATDSALEVTIQDNGQGFHPELIEGTEQATTSGHGLAIMRERAAEIGGELSINSAPGNGCQIKLRVPLKGGK